MEQAKSNSDSHRVFTREKRFAESGMAACGTASCFKARSLSWSQTTSNYKVHFTGIGEKVRRPGEIGHLLLKKAVDRVSRVRPCEKSMSPEPQLALGTDAQRYGALFRISEALSACGEPEELARVLAEQLRELISFDHLEALIFKENSNEIEWHGWGTEPLPFPDLPIEETSTWHVFRTQEPLHIADWNTDDTLPRLNRF